MLSIKDILIRSCFFLVLLVFSRCGKKDNGNGSSPIVPGSLTTAPVDFTLVSGLVPMGNLNPPGHTFPTQHMYIYFAAPGSLLNVYSPGDLHIFQIARYRNVTTGFTDYRIEFGDPSGTVLFLSHLSSIQPGLLERVGGFDGSICETYTTGGTTFEYCRKPVSVTVNANDWIATAGATSGSLNIDMGMTVNGVAACPLDYYTPSVKTMMEAKIGTASGSVRRTQPPLCGSYDLDIAGTLQGNWYKQGAPLQPEDQHIAFVKDNIQPDKLRISVGSAVPGLPAAVYRIGIPDVNDSGNATGLLDRTFSTVTADGQTYCYQPRNEGGGTIANTSLIVKIEDNNTLWFEKRNCDCSCSPYNFSGAKIIFKRNS